MSRLDRHVNSVQRRLFLGRFTSALAWSTLMLAAAVLLGVVINLLFRIFVDYLPNFPVKWAIILGAVACFVVATVWATVKRESAAQAAAAIDERLGLQAKFSTAIYVRPSADPFAQAAVHDAERTADNVVLTGKFPVRFPSAAAWTAVLAVTAFVCANYLKPLNLFAREADPVKKAQDPAAHEQAKQNVERALVEVSKMPKTVEQSDEFRKLVAELHDIAKAPKIDDPARANRRALQALQEVSDQAHKEYDKVRKYAESQNALMQSLAPPEEAKGPVADARRELVKNNFDEAAKKMEEAISNFDKMTKDQQDDAAKQMAQVAKQLEKLAQDPAVKEQIEQQLAQMGADPQAAKDMQDLMQKAAQGGQQGQAAAQQLQAKAEELAQQMNNGQGPNAQQQAQINQAIQQMQGQANAQNQANALAQASQKVAQAMQNAQQNAQQGPNANPQQAGQMAAAQQGMQQALNNMKTVKQDLQQMADNAKAAQEAMKQGQQAANGQGQPGAQQQGGQPAGEGKQPGGGKGEFAEGDPNANPQQGNQRGGPGQAAGGNADKATSPFAVKKEQSPSQDIERGRILASYFVKDTAEAGQQRMQMQKVVEQNAKEAPDEVDAEHANRHAQKVAQEYFRTMSQPAPSPKK